MPPPFLRNKDFMKENNLTSNLSLLEKSAHRQARKHGGLSTASSNR